MDEAVVLLLAAAEAVAVSAMASPNVICAAVVFCLALLLWCILSDTKAYDWDSSNVIVWKDIQVTPDILGITK